MFALLFLLLSFSKSKEINITEFLTGQWNFTSAEINAAGGIKKKQGKMYSLNITCSETNPNHFSGELFVVTNKEFAHLDNIKIDLNENIISVSNGENEEILRSPITFGVDEMIRFEGSLKNHEFFSFISLSQFEAEITIYNSQSDESQILLYRAHKERTDDLPKISILYVFLPMVPILIMLYQQSKQQELQRKQIRARNKKIASEKKDTNTNQKQSVKKEE